MTRVGPEPIVLEDALRAVEDPSCGGIAVFLGVVRNRHEGKRVTKIHYDAYPEMANAVLARIEAGLRRTHGAKAVYLAHRTGLHRVGDASVVVAVATPHRGEAFAACREGIERIKSELPVWKKEYGPGGAVWKEEVALRKPARRTSRRPAARSRRT
ncbi:MAG: molybdenum cofactor biosynthesis protein MoaE [Candidatus Brocadiae bacterium]|nr:molybdenum cofactor biosynthesis protein MoaE [Candidatus Brocadiia bacterium]